MKMRKEKDSMGEIEVPEDRLYGAQTERSHENFKIGDERMPLEVIEAFALLKKAAARVNADLGLLAEEKQELIEQACDAILTGELADHFPLILGHP